MSHQSKKKILNIIFYHDCAQIFIRWYPDIQSELTVPFEVVDGSLSAKTANGPLNILASKEKAEPRTSVQLGDHTIAGSEVVVFFLTREFHWSSTVNVFMTDADKGTTKNSCTLHNITEHDLIVDGTVFLSPKRLLPVELHPLSGYNVPRESLMHANVSDGASIDYSLIELKPAPRVLPWGQFAITAQTFWVSPRLSGELRFSELPDSDLPVYLQLEVTQSSYAGPSTVIVYGPDYAILGIAKLPNLPVRSVAKVTLQLLPMVSVNVAHTSVDRGLVKRSDGEFTRWRLFSYRSVLTMENNGKWPVPIHLRMPDHLTNVMVGDERLAVNFVLEPGPAKTLVLTYDVKRLE